MQGYWDGYEEYDDCRRMPRDHPDHYFQAGMEFADKLRRRDLREKEKEDKAKKEKAGKPTTFTFWQIFQIILWISVPVGLTEAWVAKQLLYLVAH
jgi:hypothetical protein